MTNPTTSDGREHHTLTAALAVSGAARALEFYAQAFGAQEIFRAPGPDGKIAHAQMQYLNRLCVQAPKACSLLQTSIGAIARD